MRRIVFLLILAGFLISLRPHPVNEWIKSLGLIFNSINLGDPIKIINSIIEFVNLGLQAYINPHTLWYFPAFFLPIFIAYQAASFYLADIFELEHIGIARKFIRQVALTGSNESIRIKNGEVSPEHLESPIYKIGGPGNVVVDLDSVVLFEKADGRPNVIGPTGEKPGGKEILEGFERYRQSIDLRDQFIDLNESDGKYSSVKGRSLDGMNVIATDVRLISSIHRGNQEPTNDRPYPFTKDAVERLVYRSRSKVTNYMMEPSIPKFNFESAILSMIRRELSTFMGQYRLTNYLASINFPEVIKAEEQENAVVEEARLVLEPLESADSIRQPIPSRPTFVPREEISNLFSQFAEKFTREAAEKGVELQWIGVGTWKVPMELVSQKHLEAWKMSQENERMNSENSYKSIRTEAKIQKTIAMIQTVPIEVYEDRISAIEDTDKAIGELLKEYRRQMYEHFEQLRSRNRTIPPTLIAAIFYIDRLLWRNVPPPAPPPPATAEEYRLYREALTKIGTWEVIEKLIGIEQEASPDTTREEALRRINRNWDLDITGN